ncbi:MAG: LCP family protein [Nitriliruptoraceae bacterium]
MDRQQQPPAPPGTPAEDGWGPEVAGTARRRRRRPRRLGRLLIVLLVLLLLWPLALSTRLERQEVAGLAGSSRPMHVLVWGSDSREELTPEEERELSTGSGDVFTGERADTILLLTLDGTRAAMLSFPRDLWIERCDGTTGRINAAPSIGGSACLADSIQRLSGIEPQHVVRVTFAGFRDVVDAVGGVELCLEAPIADRDAGIDLPAGCQVLDGADALGYVRVRKIDDDFARMERQQGFVKALATELVQPSVLLNPVAQWRIAGEVGDAITVSDSLGLLAIARLGLAGPAVARGDVATETVPSTPFTSPGGAWVLAPVQPDAEAMFTRYRTGTVLDRADDEVEALPAPAEVPVSVANGAGIDGLAGQVADRLRARGFPIRDVTNAPPTSVTLVRHPRGLEAAARLVATDVPGPAALEESSEVDHITVILSPEAAS